MKNEYVLKTTIIHGSIKKLCVCIVLLVLSGNACGLTVRLRTTNTAANQYALFWKDVFYVNMLDFQNSEPIMVTAKKNYVHFDVKTKSNGYFYLARKIPNGGTTGDNRYDPITPYYYFQSGDNVEIKITEKANQYSLEFQGKGAWKYQLKTRMDAALLNGRENRGAMDAVNFYVQDPCLYKIKDAFGQLQAKHSYDTVYHMMEANLKFGSAEERFHHIREIFDKYYKGNTDTRDSFFSELEKYCSLVEKTDIPPDILLKSPSYINFLFQKAKVYCYAFADGSDNLENVYDYICSTFCGQIKERLLTVLFLEPRLPFNVAKYYTSFSDSLKDKVLLGILDRVKNRFSSSVVPGDAFTDEKGKPVTLLDFKGKTVVVDFWFTGCGACLYQYKNVLSELERRLAADTGFVFVSVSADKSFSVWEKSLLGGGYTSLGRVINLFTGGFGFAHPFLKYFGIEYFPTMVILDQSGRVVMFDNADLYDREKLYSLLIRLRSR